MQSYLLSNYFIIYFCSAFLLGMLHVTPLAAEQPLTAESPQSIQSLDSITATVRAFLSPVRPGGGEPPPVTIDSLDPRLRLSACTKPLEVSLAPGSRPTGRTVVAVHCSSPHPWSLYVPAKVTTPVLVVVATRPLLRDQVLKAADATVEQRDAGDLTSGYLTDPNQVLGKILTRPATARSALTPDQVLAVRVIRRGERVTLVVQGAGLAVRSAGVALSDAGVGERVSVRNESSRRIVEGTAKEVGVVIMDW
ncbi:flagella basal body P-ring formation protein FlgA [Gammaproteobacteria bacterium]